MTKYLFIVLHPVHLLNVHITHLHARLLQLVHVFLQLEIFQLPTYLPPSVISHLLKICPHVQPQVHSAWG